MKKLKFPVIAAAILFSIQSCQQEAESHYEEASTSEMSSNNIIKSAPEEPKAPLNSTAATYQNPDKKIIRTADLSMEVDNVYESTTQIESKISELSGYVSQSNLNNRILSQETFPVSSDSALEIRKYRVANEMTLRIPQEKLGEFLNYLSGEMKFLYFRNVSANDVSLNFISSELEKERSNSTNEQLVQLNKEKGKISHKQDVINDMDKNKSIANQQKINTLRMNDKVSFSTVTLLIEEKEKVAQTMVINPKNYSDKFRPDFLYRAKVSVTEGFYFFQTICIAILYIWPVWILGILIYLFIKFQIKKQKLPE